MKSDLPVIIDGIVASRPSVSPDGSHIIVKCEKLIRNNQIEPVHGLMMLYVSEGDISVVLGDRIRFMSRISFPRLLGLPGEFDLPRYLALKKIAAIGRVVSEEDIVLVRSADEESVQRIIDQTARRLGESIRKAVPDEKVSAVLAALLLGDQKRIPRGLSDLYTRAGVNHILSISGFHVGIIATFISLAALWLLTRCEYLTLRINVRRFVILLAVPSMLFYLFLTGNAPATARSVIMLAAFACALYVERESDAVNTLLLAAFVLIAVNPPTLFDISFQLSFISLWGIILFIPFFTGHIAAFKSATGRTLMQFIAASVAASIVTLIPALFTFKVASLNGILTNFLIVPLLGYGAVLAGFCVLPLLLIIPQYNQLLLWPAAKLIEISNWFISSCAALPVIRFHGITKSDMILFLLFMCSMTFIRNRNVRVAVGAALPAVALSMHLLFSMPSDDDRLRITMLSVGQAESLLLRLPDGKYILVDGGGYLHDTGRDFGQTTLAPALGALGVNRVYGIISTHDHPDHIGGLAFTARHFSIEKFWCAQSGFNAAYSEEVRSTLSELRISVHKLAAGDTVTLSGGVELQVLSPERGASRPLDDNEMSINDDSLVFRLTYGNFSMLFAADAGFETENRMLDGSYELKSTVLKVGHHGSRYSTSQEFLERVNPDLALISAGAGNRFGLPSSRTLNLLAGKKIPVYRTDSDGSIEVVSDGLSWSVVTLSRGS